MVSVLRSNSAMKYKYLVDGEWTPDPARSETAADGFGGLNSVFIF